jgi:5S rRNA maturation endonuclease (ribonuclease M5)
VIFNCHAGCDPDDILKALGLEWADLTAPREERRQGRFGKRTLISTYDYVDEAGELLFQVCRFEPKTFRQRKPDGRGGWDNQLGNTRRVLYRLPQVIDALRAGQIVWIVEGEKDVHAVEHAGMTATCNPGGAGKWLPEYSEVFRDAAVAICADADDPGRAHARRVEAELVKVGCEVTVFEAPNHKDVADHLSSGAGLEDLEQTRGPEDTAPVLAPDLWEFLSQGEEGYDWLVPDVLERGDRLMVTGAEGLGKSVWCRQLCVQLAAGVHPFIEGEHVDPLRVLAIDCENSTRQNRRHYGRLAGVSVTKGRRVPDGNLRIIHRPEGIDLTRGADAEWLLERVHAHRPDVMYIGPFYRLLTADVNDETEVRRTVAVLDAARTVGNGCVLLMEAHAGHGPASGAQRALRPIGSSLLLRWPEFGFGLRRAKECDPADVRPSLVDLEPWRGGRDERKFPRSFRHGRDGDWPWLPEAAAPRSNLVPFSAEALSQRRSA